MKIARKLTHLILISVVLMYVLLIILFVNREVLEIDFGHQNKLDENSNEILFKFGVKLSKNGVKETILENGRTKRKVILLSQDEREAGKVIKSEEFIFIDKREYEDGRVELDQTNIKQQRQRNNNAEDRSFQHRPTLKLKDDVKYLFTLRYYEQLTMATNNFLSLASLARATGRSIVEPFVNNSRFSGLPSGGSISRLRNSSVKYLNIDRYFNRKSLQNQMEERGYNKMASLSEFNENCKNIGVVVHFLYDDPNTKRDLRRWYKLSDEAIHEIKTNIKQTGVMECNFVKNSRIEQFLGNKTVQRYLCVDAEAIKDSEEFKKIVLKDSKCSAIIFWKGNGTKRTHFQLAPQITSQLKPYEIQHSKRLIDIAHDYIRRNFEGSFISVHVRIEKHLKRNNIGSAFNCISKLTTKINIHKLKGNLTKIFLANDMSLHGSDTLKHIVDRNTLVSLERKLTTSLLNPFQFNSRKYGLYDRGSIAIVEMHILSLGESMFTLGNGNFQEWLIELFLQQNEDNKSLLHKVCDFEPTKKR